MNNPAKKLLLFLLVLCPVAAFNQTSAYTDSIKKVIVTQKADTNKLINFFSVGGAYLQYNPDSCQLYAKSALALAEQLNIEDAIFGANVLISQSLMVAGNYPLQLEYCFKALAAAKKTSDSSNTYLANMMLSDCYYHLGDYPTSLNYLRGVLAAVSKLYPDALFQVWINLSKLYGDMHQPDSALLYARKSYDGLKKNHCFLPEEYKTQAQISAIAALLGNAFLGKSQYDSALYYYNMGAPISKFYYLQTDMIDDYNGIAAVYFATGKSDSAISYSQKTLSEQITKAYPAGHLKAVNMLAAVYQSKNKPDSALKYLRIAVSVKDSLFNSEKTIAVQNLTLKEQEKERGITESKVKLENRYKVYALLAGFIVIFIIAGILFRNNRQKHMQQMRNSIADDLHDDIGSTLSSISIMSELAKEKSPDALPLLASIGENTLAIQENMSDIVWAVNPKNDRFENVTQRMNQFAAEILEAKSIELEFKSDASLSDAKLTMGQRKNFYLFFKEAINNAAKYSDATKVAVGIYQKDNHIEMTIRDDGKGFDSARIFNGNGMATLRKRGTELNAAFNITSHIKEGTVVQLKFRIT